MNSRSRVPGRSGESKKGRPQFKHVSMGQHTNTGLQIAIGGKCEIVDGPWDGRWKIGLIGEWSLELGSRTEWSGHCYALASGIHNCTTRNPTMRWNFHQGCDVD